MRVKYRIGVMPGPWSSEGGVEPFWRLIDLCEATAIDSLWFSDRLSAPAAILTPMISMAAVAARTRRLKFGPSVLIAPFRSPVMVARELAMLDWLSGGRALPAVGIGVEHEREFRAAGVPFKERGRRTDEAMAIMRRCWSGEPVTYAGEFWQLEDVQVVPAPVQRPLPLWVGGNSEAAMRRAGRLADGWIPSFITPEAFAAGVATTQSCARAAGREVPEDHFGVIVYYHFAREAAAARAAAEPYLPRGRADEATLAACTAFGPPGVLVERLEQYVRAGGSKFIARPMGPPAGLLDQVAQLADEVVPAFHAR